MGSMVDITLFVSLFSIYVILLNLFKIQVNINGYAICPDCGAHLIVDLVERPPNRMHRIGAVTKELDLHILYVVWDWPRQATVVMM
jgi:hypothetical protein